MKIKFLVLFVLLGMMMACTNEQTTPSSNAEIDNINIRLPYDPQNLHPIFKPSTVGREVFQYIFTSLADKDPDNLELIPVLITAIPEGYLTTNGDEEWINFDLEIKPGAKWSDGQPITNKDYAFTVKMMNHPNSNATRWKPFYLDLKSITIDPKNDKKLTVSFDKDFNLAKDAALAPVLLPSHIYDPEGEILGLDVAELVAGDYTEKDSTVLTAIEEINSSENQFTDVVQVGPYKVTAYEPNQYIIIEKIEDYWGAAYADNPYLMSGAKQITFKIVPDEKTAITMAKENKIDVMNMSGSTTFLDFKNDDNHNGNWNFHVPQLNRYYYVAINNKSAILSDKKVRNALAHLIDVDDLIENIDGGLGTRTIGPFHPTADHYNDKLTPIPLDLDKANSLLEEAGWTLGPDNLRTKTINGKKETLSLDVISTGSQLSKTMSLLFQESAAKAGIQLNLVTKKNSLMRKENLKPYNYDMALLAASLESDDPYQKWHSDNTNDGSRNVCAYSNKAADVLIEKTRKTNNKEERKQAALELQEIMYLDQPAIFLYCPLNKIIINKKYAATSTSKRPGYLANTFTLK